MGYSIEGIGGIRKGIVHQCVDHSEYFKFYRLIICLTIEKIGGIVESEKTNNFRLFIYIYIYRLFVTIVWNIQSKVIEEINKLMEIR